ncbi:MAG TPA: thiamine pyrophosphate-binding protein [Chloroflexota bacterium]
MPTTVEVMAEAFQEVGTPFIVGHPGGESVELMEAARQRGMRFIFVKQESAAAMLAATWGELTGSPGVCLSTRAPGAANMVNGVAHAWMDRCPLIAITDQYPSPVYETGLRQRLNHLQLYTAITKWNATIRASTVRQQLRRAVRVATAPPPGPVQFDLPSNETRQEAGPLQASVGLLPELPALRPERESLQPALEMIARSRYPVLLAGLGVLWDRAAASLVALAERLGAPVLTTPKGKGIIPEDHPLRAGVMIGGLIERDIIGRADLILAVGLDAVELQPKPWPYTAPVLALSSAPSVDALVPATVELVGQLGPLLSGLAEWAPEGGGWGEPAAREFRRRVAAALDLPSAGLSPQRLVEVARAVLPRETIATCDAGASRLLVVQKWQAYGPREFLTSNGLATMGYAIPGGLAARLAYPDRPVVCFTGDGGLLMAVAEVQTAVRENLPVIVVVFDDQEIGLIRVKQEIKGLPAYGVELGGVDWEKLANGLGAEGTTVDSENGLADALRHALRSQRTTLIGARIDKSGYVAQFNALREL